jgi:hypothetical protein
LTRRVVKLRSFHRVLGALRAAADPKRARIHFDRSGRAWHPGTGAGGRPTTRTTELDARITDLHGQGLTVRAIAAEIGKSPATVARWIPLLGLIPYTKTRSAKRSRSKAAR